MNTHASSLSTLGMTKDPNPPRPRILHRARNLLTTKGEPVPAIADTLLAANPDPDYVPLRRRRTEGGTGFGGSIRRTLSQVKDVGTTVARRASFKRSRSSPSSPPPPTAYAETKTPVVLEEKAAGGSATFTLSPVYWVKRRKSHRRAQSDSTLPTLDHAVPGDNRLSLSGPGPSPFHHSPHRPAQTRMSSLPESPSLEQQQHEQPQPQQQQTPAQISVPAVAQPASGLDATVPPLLQQGVPMLKVSAKKQKRYVFRLDPDQGQIVWESKKLRYIPIENIKELRSGADARYYREQFQLAQEYEDKWLTIVYILDGGYKTLHLIAATRDVFQMWEVTLRRLYAIRQQLMSGLGSADVRQALWEKQFWKGADDEKDQRLDFDDVERLCRRLNINPSREDLLRRFKQADSQNRGYLDFADFKRFVKSLKARPELDRLYKKIANGDSGLTFAAFEQFMRTSQKSLLSQPELEHLFLRYAAPASGAGSVPGSPPQTSLDFAMQSVSISAQQPQSPPASAITSEGLALPAAPFTVETAKLSLSSFTTFLLSADNSAFIDQHGRIYHDMTRPLPEYYISSSHNTYLVGHQLVGESTIEGYIRALLHSCRCVELDIWDGETEPMVYHGRTLTSKVSVRDTCAAIMKYAFVASPYPIILSAEIHCGVQQQEQLVGIMKEVFGDHLVYAPANGRPKIEALPSPEDLKYRVLVKAKNLYVSERQGEKEVLVDAESSTTDTSASDSDVGQEIKHEWRKARENEAELIKDLKSEFKKARGALQRVRGAGSSKAAVPSSPPAVPQSPPAQPPKVKMSMELVALLVYTVGVKCRGLNKKEEYAPEHLFSLSENTANKLLKQGMIDLIKHNRTHLVRTYPKGTRIGSTNYEPHRYWSAGCQLVALNWQTFDLGYMINHAMFQRNGRAGYVLKPAALRGTDKPKLQLGTLTKHFLNITVISAQQLPRPKDSEGREIIDKSIIDPFIEVSIHIPDWTHSPFHPDSTADAKAPPTTGTAVAVAATSARTVTCKTGVVKNNGFNPVWEQQICLPFDLVGDMKDLVFVRFAVKQEDKDDDEPLAVYCASLGSLNLGYRHLPLHDAQLSQYLFSTLFVKIEVEDAAA